MAPPTVLVVDDDPDIQLVLRGILEDEGYAVRVASNGREALECVACETPDLILLDLMMPVMDGRQFFRRFVQSQDGATDRAPVLLVSADAGLRETAETLGVDGYLRKPFNLDVLLRAVERLTAGRRGPAPHSLRSSEAVHALPAAAVAGWGEGSADWCPAGA
jgi:CheY-like chemotaxis protein